MTALSLEQLSLDHEHISFVGADAPSTAQPGAAGAPAHHVAARGLWRRRRWALLTVVMVGWSFHSATAGRGRLVNPGGWTQVDRFLSAAAHPQLSGEFLKTVLGAAATSVGYALVGTVVALSIGIVGGVLTSRLWSGKDPFDSGSNRRARRRRFVPMRLVATGARGTHEAVWALILVSVLGRNPLVAILALGLPFGAITSKVVADIIDAAGFVTVFHTA